MPAASPPSTRAPKSTSADGAKAAVRAAGSAIAMPRISMQLAPVAVADGAEVQHGGREAQRVADGDQVKLGLGRVEGFADIGEGDVGDRQVEVGDRGDQDQREEHEGGAARGRGSAGVGGSVRAQEAPPRVGDRRWSAGRRLRSSAGDPVTRRPPGRSRRPRQSYLRGAATRPPGAVLAVVRYRDRLVKARAVSGAGPLQGASEPPECDPYNRATPRGEGLHGPRARRPEMGGGQGVPRVRQAPRAAEARAADGAAASSPHGRRGARRAGADARRRAPGNERIQAGG